MSIQRLPHPSPRRKRSRGAPLVCRSCGYRLDRATPPRTQRSSDRRRPANTQASTVRIPFTSLPEAVRGLWNRERDPAAVEAVMTVEAGGRHPAQGTALGRFTGRPFADWDGPAPVRVVLPETIAARGVEGADELPAGLLRFTRSNASDSWTAYERLQEQGCCDEARVSHRHVLWRRILRR